MGRPKKPTSLKILQGSANAKRAAKTEPRPIAKAPLCPSWLSAEAKSHWEEITDKLEPLGLATSLDRDALTVYCETWSQWRDAIDALRDGDRTYTADTGYTQLSPLVTDERSLRADLSKQLAQFGMTPAARSGMKVQTEAPAENAYEAYRRRRKKT